MGYKKYSDISMAEEMVDKIRRGEIGNRNTAFRELVTIKNEWEGYPISDEAERLIKEQYHDLEYGH